VPGSPYCRVQLSIHCECGCVLSTLADFLKQSYSGGRPLETKGLFLTARCVAHENTVLPPQMALALVLPGPTDEVSHPLSSTRRSVKHTH
jgi:hypothetical protein